MLVWTLTGISSAGVKGYLINGFVDTDDNADFSLQIFYTGANGRPHRSAAELENIASWDFVL